MNDKDDRTRLTLGRVMVRRGAGMRQIKHVLVDVNDVWHTLCSGAIAFKQHQGYLIHVTCSPCRVKQRETRGEAIEIGRPKPQLADTVAPSTYKFDMPKTLRSGYRSVVCPTCSAQPGLDCRMRTGEVASYEHRTRIKAAGGS